MWNVLLQLVDLAMTGDPRALIAAVLLLSGLACFYSLFRQLQITRWPSTRGRLLKAGIEQAGADNEASERQFTEEVAYEYQVDGTSYVGHELSPWKVVASQNARVVLQHMLGDLKPNMDVEVFYNPRRPKKAFLRKGGVIGMVITVVMGLALCSVPFVLFG